MKRRLFALLAVCAVALSACAGMAISDPAPVIELERDLSAPAEAESFEAPEYEVVPFTSRNLVRSEDGKEVTLASYNYQTILLVLYNEGAVSPEDAAAAARNVEAFNAKMRTIHGELSEQGEALAGEARFQTGDTVAEGDVLISGSVLLEGPLYSETNLGWQYVRAEGSVYARTWRTMTARLPLESQTKTYTGEEETRWILNILGQRMVFSRNSGISFPKYDKISRTWTARLPGGQEMPLTLTRETAREYTLSAAPLDQFAVQDMLEGRLREMLEAELGEGEILDAKYTALLRDGALEVTLLAECREEIGRFVPGTQPDSGVQEEHEITNQ